MANPKLVQPRSPSVEITSLGNKKLQVIKPGPELVETASAGLVSNQAQFRPAVRFSQVRQRDMPVWLDVAARFLHAEQIAIPSCAPVDVADGQNDNLTCDAWHTPTPLSAVDHVNAPAWDGHDEALVSQNSERFLGGAFGNPILLGDALDRRHRLTRRDLTGSDHLAQDPGELQVGRLPSEMINGHLASVGIPWQTWGSGAP